MHRKDMLAIVERGSLCYKRLLVGEAIGTAATTHTFTHLIPYSQLLYQYQNACI